MTLIQVTNLPRISNLRDSWFFEKISHLKTVQYFCSNENGAGAECVCRFTPAEGIWIAQSLNYSFSHNHGSVQCPFLKGNYYWRYTHF